MNTQLATAAEVVEPTPEQLAALQDFANSHGRNWKSHLCHAWFSGLGQHAANNGTLRQVRNSLGPQWLNSQANPIRPQRQASH